MRVRKPKAGAVFMSLVALIHSLYIQTRKFFLTNPERVDGLVVMISACQPLLVLDSVDLPLFPASVHYTELFHRVRFPIDSTFFFGRGEHIAHI